jgi:hypothetical protein
MNIPRLISRERQSLSVHYAVDVALSHQPDLLLVAISRPSHGIRRVHAMQDIHDVTHSRVTGAQTHIPFLGDTESHLAERNEKDVEVDPVTGNFGVGRILQHIPGPPVLV